MSKEREALKLALEALEKCDSALAEELAAWDIEPPIHHVLEASNACGPAITAIREALADHVPDATKMMEHPAQQQEPVANDRVIECAKRLVEHADFKLGGVLSADSKAKDIPSRAVSQVKARHLAALRDALANTSPPASKPMPEDYSVLEKALTRLQKRYADLEGKVGKPWVGLTDEEVKHQWEVWRANAPRYVGFARGIEAKLKEKNARPSKPLTDEQIIDQFKTKVDTGSLLSFADGVRFAEAAHGIKGDA